MPVKPTETEAEYFDKVEFERRKMRETEKQAQFVEEDKRKLKELHYMRCPKCGMQLIQIDYKRIAVDKCSSCGGVWLDAGELEVVSEMDKGALGKFFSVFKK